MAPFMFCRVCRVNHDKGKGHKYAVKHKQRVGELLSKARSKIQEIRVLLKDVTLLQDDDRRGRTNFWCAFCEQEVDENESLFNRESSIWHLGGASHFTNVKKFLSEQGADVADSRRYLIVKEELTKWEERCKVLTAKVDRARGVELFGTNNIHSDTSRSDPGSSLVLGNRQIFSHDASVIDDVQPLSVLTLGSFQKPMPIYDGASSVATASGDHQRFSMSAAAAPETSQFSSNGWSNVAVGDLHYMDHANHLAPTNFGIESSTIKSSHHYYPESSNEILRGVDTIHYTQEPGAHSSALQRVRSAQYIMPSLQSAVPSQYTVMATGQDLSNVVRPPLLPGEGNVHSGATPPWIGPGVDDKLFVAPSTEIGPTMEPVKKRLLSKNQERKLAKLRPPNRVGAAWAEVRRAQLEREARGETEGEGVPQADATWLPNFGRIWQSGSRHDTRKEFEAEKRREAKRLGRPLGKRGSPSSERPVQFQPYVSKRQRAVKTDE
ncbi:hypothetical protein M758_1G015600 [Ceratodon purpureus]|nr:hypothetical protein M758_1G015600 [Ceratodon purpureus]